MRKKKPGVNPHLRQQHADLLHFFNSEQRVAGRMLEQHVQQHLPEENALDWRGSETTTDTR